MPVRFSCATGFDEGTRSDSAYRRTLHNVGHADPRTTRLYDRRKRRVTQELIDGIDL